MSASDDLRLFDAALQQALGGVTFEEVLANHTRAVERGDWERVRALDEMLRLAVALGTHAVVAKPSERSRT